MLAMMAIVLLSRGHMGIMGHGAEESESTKKTDECDSFRIACTHSVTRISTLSVIANHGEIKRKEVFRKHFGFGSQLVL